MTRLEIIALFRALKVFLSKKMYKEAEELIDEVLEEAKASKSKT